MQKTIVVMPNLLSLAALKFPVDTWLNDNLIITSKRRRDVVLTWSWCYYYVMCPLGCRNENPEMLHANLVVTGGTTECHNINTKTGHDNT